MSAEFWLNLQLAFDLRSATIALGKQIEREVVPRANRPAGV
jgi:plasmid maintenance system antidote protein VapI